MEAPKVEWVTKAIRFRYKPTPQTRELLSTFRNMVNDAIRICLDENIRGRLSLRNRIYKEFRERYRVLSYFPYSVAEVAWSIAKRHRRWHRKPRAKRLMMKIDGRSFRLDHFLLSIPFEKGRRLFVPLQFGRYQRSFLTDVTLKRGAMTMIEDHVIIAFSKRIERSQPVRRVGYDLNEKSMVGSDGMRVDLSDVARVHTLYGIRRSKFYARHPGDSRLKKKFAGSRRAKERVKQLLHKKAKDIIDKAKVNGEAIVLERLKGIRYRHIRGNGEGPRTRRRIALWPFRQLQSYIEYKAKWDGVPVEYVPAAYTSQTCHRCRGIYRKLNLAEESGYARVVVPFSTVTSTRQ